ncbi:hypothetical protein ASL14_22600 [Paenibacillus sp. IHB B 3084]|uniref:lipid II flippase Amj family protein n=1 Tax=Paenibacillus sp. IHB B 3084 TaxID=867076 RepID=UPI00071FE452|nr:lipid II flippase Amj family protein [Paenibacillus sp. IHB B 3084]ALP38552.1 hypothetical protein ASL14_22600 [Paenibacillus sp. IHB B 3084]
MLAWSFVFMLTIIIHTTDSLTYALRLGGLRARRIGLALTVAGMLLLVSRTSNMAQGPLLGGMVDQAKAAIRAGGANVRLELYMHGVLLAATVGTMIAIILYPTVVRMSARWIVHLEHTGSIPALVRHLMVHNRWKHAGYYMKRPTGSMLTSLFRGAIPKRLITLNMTVTAIYTTGVLSALYASFLWPAQGTAMSMSSGLINGMATVLLTLLIDPRLAVLSEKTLRGELPLNRMNSMYGWMIISRLGGTLLAQLLLVPLAFWLGWIMG